MRIRWTKTALSNLIEIAHYIEKDSPERAKTKLLKYGYVTAVNIYGWLEVFPNLWSPLNTTLQMLKLLSAGNSLMQLKVNGMQF
jgi:hypothetical protein